MLTKKSHQNIFFNRNVEPFSYIHVTTSSRNCADYQITSYTYTYIFTANLLRSRHRELSAIYLPCFIHVHNSLYVNTPNSENLDLTFEQHSTNLMIVRQPLSPPVPKSKRLRELASNKYITS